MGVVTSGNGIVSGGEKVDCLPALDFFSTVRIGSIGGLRDAPDSDPPPYAADVSRVAAAIEKHVRGTALALLKTSYVTTTPLPTALSIKSASSLSPLSPRSIPVAGVRAVRYPTYDKETSPGPPLDRAKVKPAAATTSDPSPGTPTLLTPVTPPISATAEAARKAAKMEEMAKKVQALKDKQKKEKQL